MATAELAALLHEERTGQMARAITPLTSHTAIRLTALSMQIFGKMAKARGIDPGQSDVSDFGRAIYASKSLSE